MAVKIAVFGLGNVGKNFLRILSESGEHLERSCGTGIDVAFAGDSRSLVDTNGIPTGSILKAKESGPVSGLGRSVTMEEVLDSGVDAIVDMSSASKDGMREKAIYLKALEKGIHVVTANKSPLALHWKDIILVAEKRGLRILHEATVAGGVPVFNFVKYSCGPSKVIAFRGIVSLTANFVLKLMLSGTPFMDAVKKAQQMGVAETDYTDDTSGLDAARKTVILANALFGGQFSLSDIIYSGLPELSEEEIVSHGNQLKLISEISLKSGSLEVRTGFQRLKEGDYLLSLGEFSLGYEIETDNNGLLRVSSGHDGPRETASAVMNDVLILAREIGKK